MRDQLKPLLLALEREMQSQGRWEDQSPDAQALASTQPFAIDTLTFDQWLQWLFLPRLHEMLAMQLPLPSSCAVCPMAEEVYGADDAGGERLRMILSEIDKLLTRDVSDLN